MINYMSIIFGDTCKLIFLKMLLMVFRLIRNFSSWKQYGRISKFIHTVLVNSV